MNKAGLPWLGLERSAREELRNEARSTKIRTTAAALCEDMPSAIENYMVEVSIL